MGKSTINGHVRYFDITRGYLAQLGSPRYDLLESDAEWPLGCLGAIFGWPSASVAPCCTEVWDVPRHAIHTRRWSVAASVIDVQVVDLGSFAGPGLR